jgi:hypothetical protein
VLLNGVDLAGPPSVRVLGHPSAEELAAVLVALAVSTRPATPAPGLVRRRRSRWRSPSFHAPGSWVA